MRSPAKKKARTFPKEFGDEDRLSRLSDKLLHKIMSFVDAKEAVQTSVLSRRWKLTWTTLPFLNFGPYENSPLLLEKRNENSSPKNCKFIRHVLSKRNHQSHISDLNYVSYKKLPGGLLENFVEYAISHNVQSLSLELFYDHEPYKLSTFSSKSLEKLTLRVNLEKCTVESDYWDLPALTTFHLKRTHNYDYKSKTLNSWLNDSLFTCLPSLRTLCLYDNILNLSKLSFSLPGLTTLRLSSYSLPTTIWDFPNLLSLQLDDIYLPDNINDIFSALVNLHNLTLSICEGIHFLSCPPQLLNLSIGASHSYPDPECDNIVVSAPKLRNFTSFDIFTAIIGVPELENVNIRLQGCFQNEELTDRKKYYWQLTNMLSGLGNAKNLTFDVETFEALNEMSNLFISFPSPFCKLKYVKLPRGFKESSISNALRSYLLGGSPIATIVTKLPQHTIPQKLAVSITDQNVVLREPLAAPNKELVNSQNVHQTLSIDTVNMYVQEEHGVKDSMVDANRVGQIDDLAEGTDKDQASSSRGGKDSGLWRSHEVNSKFVCLLDRIMHKYPETFEHFPTKNKKLCTMKLNMLCTSLNDFTTISLTDVDSDMIVGYRNVFSCLQNQGFNVDWVVNRLNYIEHLRFSKPLINELHSIDCRIYDAKTKLQELQAHVDDAKIKLHDFLSRVDEAKIKLQDLQTLRVEKLTEIEKAFGSMGTNLAVGFIGDDLQSNP